MTPAIKGIYNSLEIFEKKIAFLEFFLDQNIF